MVKRADHNPSVVTDATIGNDVHTRSRLGHSITCSRAENGLNGGAQGGTALMQKKQPEGWQTESLLFHSPNVPSCAIVSGEKLGPLVGGCLPPSAPVHLLQLEDALDWFAGQNAAFVGDLNANLHKLSSDRNRQVADCVASHGLFDLLPHFRQLKCFSHQTTWWQMQAGHVLWS